MRVTLSNISCYRCGHGWIPRKSEVRVCPACHSPYWDKQKPGSPEKDPFQTLLKEMVRRIVEIAEPEKIILFGSHATGHARPGSDVDLMVVTRHGETRREQAVELYHCLRGMGISKDIIVVRPEDVERYRDIVGTIIYPAVHQGRVLYERAA